MVSSQNKVQVITQQTNLAYFQEQEYSRVTEKWVNNMAKFMQSQLKQAFRYDCHECRIMYEKYERFKNGTGAFNRSLKDPVHANAVNELSMLFESGMSGIEKKQYVTNLLHAYAQTDRQADFEEIAFIFSIIVNSPMITMYETKY
jgi:protein-arginine kinase activator protein McsA